MGRTLKETPYYLRSEKGETFYVDTLEDALNEFLSKDGYRLTFSSGGKKLTIRRTSSWKKGFVNEKESTADLAYQIYIRGEI